MKPLTNLINVATEIIIHLCLLDHKHLQRILLDIYNNQITLSLTEVVYLPIYRLLPMHIPVMVRATVFLVVLLTRRPLPGHIIFVPSLSVLVHHRIPCQGQCRLIQ